MEDIATCPHCRKNLPFTLVPKTFTHPETGEIRVEAIWVNYKCGNTHVLLDAAQIERLSHVVLDLRNRVDKLEKATNSKS